MNFVAIDFETANEKRTSACALGIAVVENGEIIETRDWLIKPTPNYFNDTNRQIHGISPADVRNSPKFDEIFEEIQPYLEGKLVIAHNAGFDMSVLRKTLDAYDMPYGNFNCACSYLLAKAIFPDLGSHRLDVLCKRYRIPLNHHDAQSDAIGCAKLFMKLAEEKGATTIAELVQNVDLKLGICEDTTYKPCKFPPKSKKTTR